MAHYPKRIEDLAPTPVDDGFLIHDAERDRVHHLNPVAAVVLALCDGGHAAEEIPRLLQRHFDLPEPPEREVAALLARFVDAGLVVTEPAPAPGPNRSPGLP